MRLRPLKILQLIIFVNLGRKTEHPKTIYFLPNRFWKPNRGKDYRKLEEKHLDFVPTTKLNLIFPLVYVQIYVATDFLDFQIAQLRLILKVLAPIDSG